MIPDFQSIMLPLLQTFKNDEEKSNTECGKYSHACWRPVSLTLALGTDSNLPIYHQGEIE